MAKIISYEKFRIADRSCAVFAFIVSLLTYWLTMEPTVSFWDCPEYVAVADRLDIGHPPGNPIWMLTARFFINFAPDAAHKALMVNAMSGLLSALTIMLLYLTGSFICRWCMEEKQRQEMPLWKGVLCCGGGLAAALLYAWSDTFWFSAVEAEVYAYSSMFTALVVWLALQWMPHARDGRYDNRLILIAYISGVSIGVHELNLLCLPVVALIVAMGLRERLGAWRVAGVIVIGCALVGVVLYGLIPGFILLSSRVELLCVNTLGLPINAGLIIWWCVAAAAMIWACAATWRQSSRRSVIISCSAAVAVSGVLFFGSTLLSGLILTAVAIVALIWLGCRAKMHFRAWRLGAWSLAMVFLGFSGYALIIIRAAADPAMNQNIPDNIFSFSDYFTREQYGKAPLLYGPTFNAQKVRHAVAQAGENGDTVWKSGKIAAKSSHRVYMPSTRVSDAPMRSGMCTAADSLLAKRAFTESRPRYLVTDHRVEPMMTPELCQWFPRLWSTSPNDITSYEGWAGTAPGTLDTIYNPTTTVNSEGKRVDAPGLGEAYMLAPTAMQNLRYFLVYQTAYMYWRYFLWNFVGRQNLYAGHGEPDAGNFITGIDALDEMMLDSATEEPLTGKNDPGRNVYWFMPLLLGFAGLVWLLRRGRKGRRMALMTGVLFVMTGMAIIVYLNQTPCQARDRDYAFAGSFYAFALLCAPGVCLLGSMLYKLLRRRYRLACSIVASAVGLGVACQVLSQTYDDHDRSGRTATPDFARNILLSLDPDAIIFVSGDNYTFPLWYAQQVEGIRPDVRVINLSYLATPWYASQLPEARAGAKGVPMQGVVPQIASGRYGLALYNQKDTVGADAYAVFAAMYATPSRDFDSGYPSLRTSRLILASPDSLHPAIEIDLRKVASGSKTLMQRDLLMLDILSSVAHNGWKRPVYWMNNLSATALNGSLAEHLSRVGPVVKLTPGRKEVLSEKVEHLVDNGYRWGRTSDDKKVLFDPVAAGCMQEFRSGLVVTAADMARKAAEESDTTLMLRALSLARKVEERMPGDVIPFGTYYVPAPEAGYTDEGAELARVYISAARMTNDKSLMQRGLNLLDSRIAYAKAHQRRADNMRPSYRKYITYRSRDYIRALPYMQQMRDSLVQLNK